MQVPKSSLREKLRDSPDFTRSLQGCCLLQKCRHQILLSDGTLTELTLEYAERNGTGHRLKTKIIAGKRSVTISNTGESVISTVPRKLHLVAVCCFGTIGVYVYPALIFPFKRMCNELCSQALKFKKRLPKGKKR
jgi:hypothetical protein